MVAVFAWYICIVTMHTRRKLQLCYFTTCSILWTAPGVVSAAGAVSRSNLDFMPRLSLMFKSWSFLSCRRLTSNRVNVRSQPKGAWHVFLPSQPILTTFRHITSRLYSYLPVCSDRLCCPRGLLSRGPWVSVGWGTLWGTAGRGTAGLYLPCAELWYGTAGTFWTWNISCETERRIWITNYFQQSITYSYY